MMKIFLNIRQKQKEHKGRSWVKTILAAALIIILTIIIVIFAFFYRISSQNRKHEQLETEIKQQMKDAVNDYANDYGNVVPILESYPDGNGKCGFRLSESGSDKTEKSYELEATKDAGKSWSVVNDDPFAGKTGIAEGIIFFTTQYGYIGLTDETGEKSEIYVTYDGGESFIKIEISVDMVPQLKYDAADYDYYSMPTESDGKTSINVTTMRSDSGELVFVSEDDGKTWSPAE